MGADSLSVKLKNYFKILLIFFACSTVITAAFVVYLFLYSIDPQTLFYYTDAKLVTPTNVILLVSTVVMITPFFLRRQSAISVISKTKNKLLGIFSLLTALGFIVSGFSQIAQTISSGDDSSPFIIGLFQIIASICFILFAINNLTEKSFDLRAVALLPVCYGVVSLIITFMGLTQIANISVYLYEILQMVFAIVFLYYNARIVGGLTNKREVFGAFAFGLPCAFYGIISTVPSFIAHLANNDVGKMLNCTDIAYILLSAYIIVLLTAIIKASNNED